MVLPGGSTCAKAMFVATAVIIGQLINFPKIGQYDAGFGRVIVASDTLLSWAQVALVSIIGLVLFGISVWMWRTGRLDGRNEFALWAIFGKDVLLCLL